MEPQVKPNTMNLPPVPVEIGAAAGGLPAEQQPGLQPEADSARPELGSSQPAAPAVPVGPIPTVPFKAPIFAQNGGNDVATTTNSSLPQVADDNDLIEKEWVSKAKEIVAKTSENPYLQSKEMTGLKADYMQKRYQKTVKLSE